MWKGLGQGNQDAEEAFAKNSAQSSKEIEFFTTKELQEKIRFWSQ